MRRAPDSPLGQAGAHGVGREPRAVGDGIHRLPRDRGRAQDVLPRGPREQDATYFTRLAQYLGNYLKGVEALGDNMLRMYVTDVDKYPTDRFPIFAKAVANHINRTFANMQKTDFFA